MSVVGVGWREYVPRQLRRRLPAVWKLPGAWRIASDREGRVRLSLLLLAPTRKPKPPIGIRLRGLDGRRLLIRPGTTDAQVVYDTFLGEHHLPPGEADRVRMRLVYDLGANIGATACHMAANFPEARIVCVEPDSGNAMLARRNLEPWQDRSRVVEAAVWSADGEIGLHLEPGEEYGARVVTQENASAHKVPAVSLESLFAIETEPIDYVKMDIEGAEREVLQKNTEWARRVLAIRVETHRPYSNQECARDLEALGFETEVDAGHWSFVIGRRTADA